MTSQAQSILQQDLTSRARGHDDAARAGSGSRHRDLWLDPGAICSGMSCLKSMLAMSGLHHALKDRPLKKYKFTHAFSPDPGWGPGSAPARQGRRGRTPGLDQDSRASLSSCCSRHKTSSKILSSRPPCCSFPVRRSSSRSSPGPRTSRPSTSPRCATRPVTSRSIPVTATRGPARARSRSSTVRAGSCAIVVIPSRSWPSDSTFVETAWLLIYGELPTAAQLARFRELLTEQNCCTKGCVTISRAFRHTVIPWRCSRR